MSIKLRNRYNNINYRVTGNGQSLFEVVFAVGISAMVLVGALSLSTLSLRNSNFAKNDSLATKFAQEGTEWLREQRDQNWTNLSSRLSPNYRCLVSPPGWGSLVGGTCSNTCSIGNGFRRCVQLTNAGTDEIDVVVTVEWTDGQGNHNVRSATKFTRWH